MKSKRQKRFYVILGILTLLGLLFRLIVSAQLLKNDPFAFAPISDTDMATYHKLSDGICKGEFPEVFYYQPYYYSVFLPLAKLLTFGARLWGPALAQALCGAGIIWFGGLTAALLKGRKAGLFAGFLAAFSLILTVYTPYALLEISQCFHFTLLAYFTIRLMKKDSIWLWCGAGLTLSAAILSRGNALCFLPALCFAFYTARKRFCYPAKKMALLTSVFLLCLILPQLPFVIRNTVSLGQLTGPSSAGPAVLALGNNPEAPPGGLDLVYPRGYDIWMASKSVPEQIVKWFLNSPIDFLEFQCRKFLLFWDHNEIPNNISLPYTVSKSSLLTYLPLIPTGIILVLAITSFVVLLRRSFRDHTLAVFLLFPLLYALAAAAFYILARFRVPAVGLLCTQAGLVLPVFLAAWKKKDHKFFLFYRIAPLMIAAGIVYLAYESYTIAYEPAFMRVLRPNGVCLDDIEKKQMIVFDHGPQLPLGWEVIPLKNGMEVRKHFVMPKTSYTSAQLELRFVVFQSCSVQYRINDGEEKTLVLAGPGRGKTAEMRNIRIPLQTPAIDGIYRIRLESGLTSNGESAGLFVDFRRNYGRTYIDGKPFPGEAVIRLELMRGFVFPAEK